MGIIEYVERETKQWSLHKRIAAKKKEYKSSQDWVEMVVYRELFKRLKCDHIDKRYMRKPETLLENETHKIHWDFEIKHITQKNRPNLNRQVETKVLTNDGDFTTNHSVKINEKLVKYLDPSRELGNIKVTVIPIIVRVMIGIMKVPVV